jgi:hypothetical protein
VWRFLTLLLMALLLGLSFAHALEAPSKFRYDAELYVSVQQTLYVEWGPPNVGGFLEPAAIVATIVAVFLVRRDRSALILTLLAAVLLLLAFPVVFFWLVAPANAFFRDASLSAIPPDWTLYRQSWEMGHLIRFGLQVVAFSLMVASVVADTPRAKR